MANQPERTMATPDVKISVLISSRAYYGGSMIEGRIFLSVECPTFNCSELFIILYGEEYSFIRYDEFMIYGPSGPEVHYDLAKETHSILDLSASVARFTEGNIIQGNYEFPFSIQLPPDLPTTVVTNHYGIRYALEARIDYPGVNTIDVTHTIKLKVVHAIPKPLVAPYMGGPTVHPMHVCCWSSGQIVLGVMVDKAAVVPGKEVSIYILLKNSSSTPIESVIISILEVVHWKAQRHRDHGKRTLFSSKIPVNAIPGAQVNSDIPAAALQQGSALEGLFRIQNEIIWEVPKKITPDYRGTLLAVSHVISVTAVAMVGTKTMEEHIPLQVFSCFIRPDSDIEELPVVDFAEVFNYESSEDGMVADVAETDLVVLPVKPPPTEAVVLETTEEDAEPDQHF